MTSNSTPIDIGIPLDGAAHSVLIEVSGFDQANLAGTLVLTGCVDAAPPCTIPEFGDTINDDADTIIVSAASATGLTDLIVTLALTCTQTLNITITASTGAPDPVSSASVDITCNPVGQGDGVDGDEHDVQVGGVYQVVVTAVPNILPCEGGTTTVTAELVDAFGNNVLDPEFRFFTTAGSFVQIAPDTIKLTLGPNQTSAVVTATIPDEFDLDDVHIDVVTTTVKLACNGDVTTQTLVVTASPNVIECTGTTTITATVRDINGHVVPGRGFHFVTSAGLLTVNPNNASTEEGVATLKLRPGDGDATVAVSSGLLLGTYEELDGQLQGEGVGNEPNFVVDETNMVTVKQNCLSTTTGAIKVNSSASQVACGENVFIGLSVIDEDIQTVVDQTPMTLIASAGGFYGGVDAETGLQTLLPAAQVPTSHGEANTIFTAPTNFSGEVKITAASGDAYGFTKLTVTCVVSAPNTGGGTGSSSPPPCVNIGDGVCITPPNTGRNQITPPSTGGAGLK